MTMRCDHTGYIATHKQTHAKLQGSGHGKDKAAWIGRQSNRDWRTLTYAQKKNRSASVFLNLHLLICLFVCFGLPV